jgi:hypothetical protein
MPKISDCDRPIKLIINVSFVALTLSICSQTFAQFSTASNPVSNTVLKPYNCQEENLRSLKSDVSTNIQFINRKPFRVKVYWLDFTGKRQHYFDLEPNETRDQQTFVTHPWLITEAGANQPCLNIYFPVEKPGIIVLE